MEEVPEFGEEAAARGEEFLHGVHVRWIGAASPEEIGDQDFAPGAGGVAVGEELVVDEFQAEGVWKVEDCRFGVGVAGDVCFPAVERLESAGWFGMIVDGTFEAFGARHGGFGFEWLYLWYEAAKKGK